MIDRPIDENEYRQALVNDYRYQSGLFLDKLVINKVIDGVAWRYAHSEVAYHLLRFDSGKRTAIPITGLLPEAIANHFEIDGATVCAALRLLKIGESAGDNSLNQ